MVLLFIRCSYGASFEIMLDRAREFKNYGLPLLAREQYLFILRAYPAKKGVAKELNELSHVEAEIHLKNALYAREVGALGLALVECDRALAAEPKNEKAKNLKAGV